MKIDDWFPNPIELIECEFRTLRFIKDEIICEKYRNLISDAVAYFPKYYNLNKSKKPQNFGFSFKSNFDIEVNGRGGVVYIGAYIEHDSGNQFNHINYSLEICKVEDTKLKLLRRFHFDYAPLGSTNKSSNRRQPHPVFHLQYGGSLSPKLDKEGPDDECLYPKLSEPRISYSPMSLALLINLVLKEFPDEKNLKIIQKNEWRSLIRKNEDLFLKPFYKKCCGFFSSRENDKLFTNDFYYGN